MVAGEPVIAEAARGEVSSILVTGGAGVIIMSDSMGRA